MAKRIHPKEELIVTHIKERLEVLRMRRFYSRVLWLESNKRVESGEYFTMDYEPFNDKQKKIYLDTIAEIELIENLYGYNIDEPAEPAESKAQDASDEK